MNKFKAGDVVKSPNGCVHLYITSKRFIHLITLSEGMQFRCQPYDQIFEESGDSDEEGRKLIFNLSEGLGQYLGYIKLNNVR